VKQAEDSCEFIIRLYECYNRRSNVILNFAFDIHKVVECDLMGNRVDCVQVEVKQISFEIKPYEIKTFKVNFK
jgi:alpha-mannosidase